MTTDELYDIVKREFDEIKTTLVSIDNRLRNVETNIAELKAEGLPSAIGFRLALR